jgi:hypothetical protein
LTRGQENAGTVITTRGSLISNAVSKRFDNGGILVLDFAGVLLVTAACTFLSGRIAERRLVIVGLPSFQRAKLR